MSTCTLNFPARRSDLLRLASAERGGCDATAQAAPRAVSGAAVRAVSRRRAEAMRGFFPLLSLRMTRRSVLAEMEQIDGYLSQAGGMADLELRIREIDGRRSEWRWS